MTMVGGYSDMGNAVEGKIVWHRTHRCLLLVVGFRLCRSADRERSVEDIRPARHWDDFVTVLAESQHFVILKACEIIAMTALSRSTLRESTALTEVA
jgi:hypothetical protein